MSPEQLEDCRTRQAEFIKEYDEMYQVLKEKHESELTYSVVTVPSLSGVFGLTVSVQATDTKYKPTPSPDEFIPKSS